MMPRWLILAQVFLGAAHIGMAYGYAADPEYGAGLAAVWLVMGLAWLGVAAGWWSRR